MKNTGVSRITVILICIVLVSAICGTFALSAATANRVKCGDKSANLEANEDIPLDNKMAAIVPFSTPDDVFEIDADNAPYFYPDYPVNANGETYGSSSISIEGLEPGTIVVGPDLIQALGADGTEGYVRSSDFFSERPNNPEEALRMQEEREARGAYTIPLYASDGITVIGEFWMYPPSAGASYAAPPRDVRAVAIVYGSDDKATAKTDILCLVGNLIVVGARIEPIGIKKEIIWSSSDPSVIEVIKANLEGTLVNVSCLRIGEASLTVSVGGVEAECIIRIQ